MCMCLHSCVYLHVCLCAYMLGCVFMCLCVCMHMLEVLDHVCRFTCLSMCIHVKGIHKLCVHACRLQKLMPGFFLNCSPLYSLSPSLSLKLELTATLAGQ